MVRRFLDDFSGELGVHIEPWRRLRGTLATGRIFSPFLKDCVGRLNRKLGCRLEVIEVENRFMGPTITVAGLLSGRDFADALTGRSLGDFVVVPGEALSRAEGMFVDDLTPSALAERLGKPVHSGGRAVRELFQLLRSLA
jgi:NifB/MoaA-like Fe-S oxidoreductase